MKVSQTENKLPAILLIIPSLTFVLALTSVSGVNVAAELWHSEEVFKVVGKKTFKSEN